MAASRSPSCPTKRELLDLTTRARETGRPWRLTSELQDAICRLLALGNTSKTAAAAVGLAPASFFRWRAIGRGADAAADAVDDDGARSVIEAAWDERTRRCVEFHRAVTRARALGLCRAVAHIALAAEHGDWRAAAFLLERRDPENWGTRPRLTEGAPAPAVASPQDAVRYRLERLTLAQLEQLDWLLSAAAGSEVVVETEAPEAPPGRPGRSNLLSAGN